MELRALAALTIQALYLRYQLPEVIITVLRQMNIATDGGNAYGALVFALVNNLIADTKTVTVNEDSSVKITLTGSGGSLLKLFYH
jgi:hypothetical protein